MNGDIMIRIEWDENSCTDPQACYKCLGACPEQVFLTYPRNKRGPGKAGLGSFVSGGGECGERNAGH